MDVSCLENKRVLIVEDELMIAMGYEAILEDHGCKVAGIAATVEQALRLVESTQPDAALLDGNLNGKLSGPVAEALEARRIPYLLVTGFVHLAIEDTVLARAPRLEKPFLSHQLSKKMVELFC